MNQHLNEQYSPNDIDAIWQQATVVLNIDPTIYQKNKAGPWKVAVTSLEKKNIWAPAGATCL